MYALVAEDPSACDIPIFAFSAPSAVSQLTVQDIDRNRLTPLVEVCSVKATKAPAIHNTIYTLNITQAMYRPRDATRRHIMAGIFHRGK